MWQSHDSAYDTSTTQWWAQMMKEWRAWEYLVMRVIKSLERMTKNAEMKWIVTKGNENLSIIPLSFLGNMWRPMWVANRRSEFQMIQMGLDRRRVDHRKLNKRVRSLSETFQQLPLLSHNAYHKCLTLAITPVPPSSVPASGETLLGLSTNGSPVR